MEKSPVRLNPMLIFLSDLSGNRPLDGYSYAEWIAIR